MSDPARFLGALSQALATQALYGPEHPATTQAAGVACRQLEDLQRAHPHLEFTFLPDEVLFGRELLPELEHWEWSGKLAAAGIERIEASGPVGEEQFLRFLGRAASVLGMAGGEPLDLWQDGVDTIRFGRLRVGGAAPAAEEPQRQIATIGYSLREEREAVGWMHQEVGAGASLPLLEAYGVVRSLSLAMHGGQGMVLPLLQLKEFDQYTTTHSINVAVLTMALGEYLGFGASPVQAFGLAGLLHDLGKVTIPHEILIKPGKLTADERAVVEQHPVAGARLILEGDAPMDLAAVVAHEHHRCHDGTGYPRIHFPREAHQASRLVHVCDVYDALRTRRPYRDAWSSAEALSYIERRAGSEFDPAMASAFLEMMRGWDVRISVQQVA